MEMLSVERLPAKVPQASVSVVCAEEVPAIAAVTYFVARAQGPYVWDVDGNQYIDYIGSWGPMILGHGHPAVLEAAVVGQSDEHGLTKPRAFVVLRDRNGTGEPLIKELQRFVKENQAQTREIVLQLDGLGTDELADLGTVSILGQNAGLGCGRELFSHG